AVFFAVTGLAVDDKVALLLSERCERHVGGNLFLFGENEQVLLRLTVDVAFPALDDAVVDRERLVRQSESVIDFDYSTKTATARAGAEWRIKGKERGRGGAEGSAGLW